MTAPLPQAGAPPRPLPPRGWPPAARWLAAVLRTSRPAQWPKNLLVLAAPLAAASQGRDDGFGYALVAVAAFTAASCAVYFVNDVADAERDRRHPVKRSRPVAAGLLPGRQALAVAALAVAASLTAAFWIRSAGLAAAVAAYLAASFLYTLVLKHVPVVEVACVASGFVLRALGGAAATHVPPSGWFLTVCSLGALLVAVSKRRGELAALGADAARHRPVMRWYRYRMLRNLGRLIGAAMLAAYALWALSGRDGWARGWHLASIVPLAVALIRFGWLGGRGGQRVEDLIIRDPVMISTELAWLVMFTAGM